MFSFCCPFLNKAQDLVWADNDFSTLVASSFSAIQDKAPFSAISETVILAFSGEEWLSYSDLLVTHAKQIHLSYKKKKKKFNEKWRNYFPWESPLYWQQAYTINISYSYIWIVREITCIQSGKTVEKYFNSLHLFQHKYFIYTIYIYTYTYTLKVFLHGKTSYLLSFSWLKL